MQVKYISGINLFKNGGGCVMPMIKRSITSKTIKSAYTGEASFCKFCGRVVLPSQIKTAGVCPLCGKDGLSANSTDNKK